jgi:hypothetical protein
LVRIRHFLKIRELNASPPPFGPFGGIPIGKGKLMPGIRQPLRCLILPLCLGLCLPILTHAGHPSGGGGGFNWMGATSQILQGAQSIRNSRGYSPSGHGNSNYNYSQPQTLRRQQYNLPSNNYNYNYSQGYRNSPQSYRNYPQQYQQPNYVTPNTHVAPAPNSYSNSMPRTVITPAANTIPSLPAVAPPTNNLPRTTVTSIAPINPAAEGGGIGTPMGAVTGGGVAPAPVANNLPAVTGAPNPAFANWVAGLTQADIDNLLNQMQEQDMARLNEARQIPLMGLEDTLNDLPGADQLSPQQRQALRDAINAGNPDAIRALLSDAQIRSAAGQDLINRAAAVQMVDRMRDRLANNQLNGADLAGLVAAAQNLQGPGQADMLGLIGQIAVDQQIAAWLGAGVPLDPGIPFGPDVPIALIPGLPDGMMIPLADGPVMIGMGAPGDEILLGTGNPALAAGFPVPIPGASPAPAATGPIAGDEILLENAAAETVNYNLNQSPYVMQSKYQQTLPAGTTWTVEFDRGGGNGTAVYQLEPGVYEFQVSEQGWELYSQSFKALLDNSGNKIDFNYVVDNQRQLLPAGQSQELAGRFRPVVKFDNGTGSEIQRQLDNGTYRVAITPARTLDVFAADSVLAPARAGSPTAPAPVIPSLARSSGAPPSPLAPRTAAPGAIAATPSAPAATRSAPAAGAEPQRLPAGFRLFDPVKALTDQGPVQKLPAKFTLFQNANTALRKMASIP